jgi:glycosyltransferase involved in cell wall biosynthesis
MISICIPIYNVNVTTLVEGLLAQANSLNVPFEIILIDDSSYPEFTNENMKLKAPNLTYLGLHENIGRARIRNMFISTAHYNHLLFLDCDSQLVSDMFLRSYIVQIDKGEKIVCGGRVYTEKAPSSDKLLHWKYGKDKESKAASVRMANPYRSFMTNNFLIEKKVLEKVPFDERISGYGHEDTLFGYQLQKQGIPIKHIDNPILHAELQTNTEFLEKSENAISNLKDILSYVNNDKVFIKDVTLLKYFTSLKKMGLLFLVKLPFSLTRSMLKSRLSKGMASMALFDFYKLGYLATIKN